MIDSKGGDRHRQSSSSAAAVRGRHMPVAVLIEAMSERLLGGFIDSWACPKCLYRVPYPRLTVVNRIHSTLCHSMVLPQIFKRRPYL